MLPSKVAVGKEAAVSAGYKAMPIPLRRCCEVMQAIEPTHHALDLPCDR